MVTLGTQQMLLEHAAVCSELLKRSSPSERIVFWHLRELWKALAAEAWRFEEAELAEEVEGLSDVQASLLAEMRPTLH
jgi:hypothetical protein